MGQEKLSMGQESLMRWDRRRLFDGREEVDFTFKKDNIFATNVQFLFVSRQLLSY
jgi:hypothetical protein